jgi:hypothetical protein
MQKFLYLYNVTLLYIFRAVLFSSSGGQIVCTQHLVSLLAKSGRGGRAHPQEVKLYVHDIWYRHSLRVVVVVVLILRKSNCMYTTSGIVTL